MIAFPAGASVWIAGGVTDMRRGMNSLALMRRAVNGRRPLLGPKGRLYVVPGINA